MSKKSPEGLCRPDGMLPGQMVKHLTMNYRSPMHNHNDGVMQATITDKRNPLTTVTTTTRRCKLLHKKNLEANQGEGSTSNQKETE